MENIERFLIVKLREERDIVWEAGEHDGDVLVGLTEQLPRLTITAEIP